MPEQANRLTPLVLIDSWIVATHSSGRIANGNVTTVWHPFTSVSRKAHLIFLWFDEWPTSFLRTHGEFTYLLGEKCTERVRLTPHLWAVGRYYKANMILSTSVWEGRVCRYSYIAKHFELQLLVWEKPNPKLPPKFLPALYDLFPSWGTFPFQKSPPSYSEVDA